MAQVDCFVALIKVIESLVNCHLILLVAENLLDHSIVGPPTDKCRGVILRAFTLAAELLQRVPRRGVRRLHGQKARH